MIVVVAGVAGSGKTTVGSMLARRMGWTFEDGDDLHSAASVAKMRAGIPLTDADRAPWLRTIARWMDQRIAAGESGVVACSALRRSSRDLLLDGRPQARLVFLQVEPDRLRARLTARQGHFFPRTLLASQLAAAELPAPGPRVLVVKPGDQPGETVHKIVSWLTR